MKKIVFSCIFIVLFSVSFFSCGPKKAKNIDDLKKKYEKFEFKNCEELIEALNESADIYFIAMEDVSEDMEKENEVFYDFIYFINDLLYKQDENFLNECGNQLEEFDINIQNRLIEKYGIDAQDFEDVEYDEEYIDDYIEFDTIGNEDIVE